MDQGSSASASDSDSSPRPAHHARVAPAYPLGPDDWQGWYATDLWDMYNDMRQCALDRGIHHNVLTNCTFGDFCAFCYSVSRHAAGRAT